MTPYELLKQHLAEHAYKRGKNKGEAPMDAHRRRRDWERVIDRGPYMAVLRCSTDIIRAYPDGRVVINCGGWASSPTTRQGVSDGLRLMYVHWRMGSVRYKNLSQPMLYNTDGRTVRYYDDITLQPNTHHITELLPFQAKVKDTDRTKEFREQIKPFKQMFPILHSAAEPEHGKPYWKSDPARLYQVTTDPSRSEEWLSAVAAFKWTSRYVYEPEQGRTKRVFVPATRSETWRKLTNSITKSMTKIVDTDVTKL
jgi:hypothetical protein